MLSNTSISLLPLFFLALPLVSVTDIGRTQSQAGARSRAIVVSIAAVVGTSCFDCTDGC